jgi:hypothetical protein
MSDELKTEMGGESISECRPFGVSPIDRTRERKKNLALRKF